MSGVAVVRYLLANAAAVTALVPATRIRAGILPMKTEVPAISVQQVDGFPRLTVAMSEAKRLVTERVQVTVLAGTYPQKRSILTAVKAALPLSHSTVNGVQCDSILPDSFGPDMDDPETDIYTLSRDFIVRWHE